MEHIIEVEEITIKVPWGHVAAKWWGSRQIRPIVMLHGWQDNAGTFDPLIPLLPRHLSYLAIDLPGHGRSSHLPHGMVYSNINYIYVLRMIYKQFKWDKISLIGHSMGALISYTYAFCYGNECDMVVAIDALVPFPTNKNLLLDVYRNGLNDILVSDKRNIVGTEPPSYSYEEAIQKLLSGTFSSYTRESLPYLLQRGIKESKFNPDKYFFVRDNRIKTRINYFPMTKEAIVAMAESISVPYCYIKALQCGFNAQWDFMDEILRTMKDSNPSFKVHGVDGDHHVHLTEPEKVSEIISRFIELHRPVNKISKL